jgi:hypothetical protein
MPDGLHCGGTAVRVEDRHECLAVGTVALVDHHLVRVHELFPTRGVMRVCRETDAIDVRFKPGHDSYL